MFVIVIVCIAITGIDRTYVMPSRIMHDACTEGLLEGVQRLPAGVPVGLISIVARSAANARNACSAFTYNLI